MTTSVIEQVLSLEHKTIDEIRRLWLDLFGEEAPAAYSRRYLIPRLAYRLQELAYGGLSEKAAKQLDALADQMEKGSQLTNHFKIHKPCVGTTLIREFQGVPHTVTVTTDGFTYQGQPYKSLSAIARKITGTRWNGLIFFGVKK